MKKYALIAGLLMIQAPFAHNAEAGSSFAAKDLAKLVAGAAGKDKFCRKGSFFSGTFSIRSLDGAFCNDRGIAALAEKLCVGIEDYENSKCHKNAVKTLAGQSATKVLEEEAKSNPSTKKLVEKLKVNVEETPAEVE